MRGQITWTYSNSEAHQLETLQALKLPTAPGPGRTVHRCTEVFPEQHIKYTKTIITKELENKSV